MLDAGDAAEAVKWFEGALQFEADAINCMNLAQACWAANRRDRAVELAERALQMARAQHDAALVE